MLEKALVLSPSSSRVNAAGVSGADAVKSNVAALSGTVSLTIVMVPRHAHGPSEPTNPGTVGAPPQATGAIVAAGVAVPAYDTPVHACRVTEPAGGPPPAFNSPPVPVTLALNDRALIVPPWRGVPLVDPSAWMDDAFSRSASAACSERTPPWPPALTAFASDGSASRGDRARHRRMVTTPPLSFVPASPLACTA